MIGNIATGYAITYIFGLAGLIAIIKLLPQLLGIDLEKEAKALEKKDKSAKTFHLRNISARMYEVTNEEFTKIPAKKLRELYWDKASVVKIQRNGKIIQLKPEEFLQLGDRLRAIASADYFANTISKFGEEVAPEESAVDYQQSGEVVVLNKDFANKTLEELDIAHKFGILITRIKRMGLELPLTACFEIHKGDVLHVVGPIERLEILGQALGKLDRDIEETDMVTFAFGIAIGVVIGMFAVTIGQLSIGLGSAGGLLASGLAIGYLRSIHPTFGRLPRAAQWILMEFGLLLFMAGVGLRAGADIIETFVAAGPVLIFAGICVTVIPIMVGYIFGRKVLKINPVLLFGGITGSMTSGASLSVVTKAAKSSMPSLGYTGAYAFANVLLTIAGSIILFF